MTAPARHIRIAIGLGGNQGDRLLELRLARDMLAGMGTIAAVSSIYETEPWGGPKQPDYLNAVLILETKLFPQKLLEECQCHETARGRERATRWGPRPIDCDLLLAENLVLDTESLLLPHPRLAERRFVLLPLSELAPTWRHPLLGRTVADLLASCQDQGRVLRTPSPFV